MQAAELFLETLQRNNKRITGKDVFDLIRAQKYYPIRKLRSDHKTSRIFKDQVTADFESEITFKLDLLRT